MKERKVSVISIFICILLLIIIGLLTYVIFSKNYNIDQAPENEDKVIEEVADSNEKENDAKEQNESVSNSDLTKEEAMRCIKEVLYSPGNSVTKASSIYGADVNTNKENQAMNSAEYTYTDIAYSKFLEKALNIYTEALFESEVEKIKGLDIILEENGKLVIRNYGASGVTHEILKIEEVEKSSNSIVYNVEANRAGGAWNEYTKYKFVFTLNDNNKYVVDSYTNDQTAKFKAVKFEYEQAEAKEYFAAISAGDPDTFVKAVYGEKDYTLGETFNHENANYTLTDLDYAKFESTVLSKFSKEFFENLNKFKNLNITMKKDGKLAILQGGWSGSNITRYSPEVIYINKYTGEAHTTIKSEGGLQYLIEFKCINDKYVITNVEKK